MPAAGDLAAASDVNRRVATDDITTDSVTYGATESAALLSATWTAVAGARYGVRFTGHVSTDVAADLDAIRIREDSATGNQLASGVASLASTTANGLERFVYAEWTASATASKTLVVTGQRIGGTGTAHRIRAGTTRPAYLTVDRLE